MQGVDKIDEAIDLYLGPLSHELMSKDARQGYVSWANQRAKCYNSKDPCFKWYGDKGIEVLYNSRDFVSWWLHNLSLKSWKDPTVGRIDHDGNYCFANIVMEERTDNSMERFERHGIIHDCSQEIIQRDFKTKTPIRSFKSIDHASKELKINYRTVKRILSKQMVWIKYREIDLVFG